MILVLLLGLAVATLTRVWRDDQFTEGMRERVATLLEYDGDGTARHERLKDWLYAMQGCPWCISGWIALAFVIFTDSATSRSIDLPFAFFLAVWWVARFAYWGLEAVADADALLWNERENRKIV